MVRAIIHKITPVLLLLAAAGCKDRDESLVKDFLDRPLSGMIGGKEWQLGHAFVDPTAETTNEEDYMLVFLPMRPGEPCIRDGDLPPGTPIAMVSAPAKAGKKSYRLKMGTSRAAVFQYDRKGQRVALVAKTGKVRITKVTDDVIRGEIVARRDSANWVNGVFEAVRCDWGAFQ